MPWKSHLGLQQQKMSRYFLFMQLVTKSNQNSEANYVQFQRLLIFWWPELNQTIGKWSQLIAPPTKKESFKRNISLNHLATLVLLWRQEKWFLIMFWFAVATLFRNTATNWEENVNGQSLQTWVKWELELPVLKWKTKMG